MNVQEGLQTIRARLNEHDADTATFQLVDAIMKRAALPAASSATAGSMLQLVRMLMRSPQASANPTVYNDLVKVESEYEQRSAEYREQVAAEEARPVPKLKKEYKKKK
ncbi:MAG: hypothetical protein M3451_08625 [Chloroflexota bacterium]|nr:hypothetical protein [Chloroflexota bacterium]